MYVALQHLQQNPKGSVVLGWDAIHSGAASTSLGLTVRLRGWLAGTDLGCERKFTGAASADAFDEQERQARPVRDYLAALDAALPAAPDERKPAPPKYTSPTDPQAAWSIKPAGPASTSAKTGSTRDARWYPWRP